MTTAPGMPKPLTMLWRCPEPSCGLLGDDGTYCCGRGEGHHTRARQLEPVFSAGDMQAALEELDDSTAHLKVRGAMLDDAHRRLDGLGAPRHDDTDYPSIQSAAERIGWVARSVVDPLRMREVELVKVLRRMVEVVNDDDLDWHEISIALTAPVALAEALLGDTPRTHEVVPLGTQEVLREMYAIARRVEPVLARHVPNTPVHKALLDVTEQARALEGAGHGPCDACGGHGVVPVVQTPEVQTGDPDFRYTEEPCPRCARPLVEGVERTPTPEPLVPGAAARADALACPRCGGVPAGEASGAGDLCVCPVPAWELDVVREALLVAKTRVAELESGPSPGGITDEMVEAAAQALMGEIAQSLGRDEEANEESEPWRHRIARAVLTAALELQGGERTPETPCIADEAAEYVSRRLNPQAWEILATFPPPVQKTYAETLRSEARQALATMPAGGERTHTLVPPINGETAICCDCAALPQPSCEVGCHGLETLSELIDAYSNPTVLDAPRGHTPVPNRVLEYAADSLADAGGVYRNTYKPGTPLGDRAEPTYAICGAFLAAARGEHPVQWPETGAER